MLYPSQGVVTAPNPYTTGILLLARGPMVSPECQGSKLRSEEEEEGEERREIRRRTEGRESEKGGEEE